MPNILTIILLYALGMFVLIYVFTVIPGKKKNKQVRAMHDAVKPGDEIVTIGGIVGTVLSREGDELVIGLDDKGGTLRLLVFAVQSVRKPAEEASAEVPSVEE